MLKFQVVGELDLVKKYQVFIKDDRGRFYWFCVGKSYWIDYRCGNRSLEDVIGGGGISLVSPSTVERKLGISLA